MSITVFEGIGTAKKTYIYYYDRVRINTRLPLELLTTILPESNYSQYRSQFSLHEPYKKARDAGFRSRIELSDPSSELIQELSLKLAGMRIFISYVEITKDIVCQTKTEASFKTAELIETIRKKHSSLPFIYDQKKSRHTKSIIRDPALFSDKTGYFGSKHFKYVPYARLSKINNLPCIHVEWRITGASFIKRKTGIRTITDLATFDIQRYFEETTAQYIVHEEIDIDKLGKWITNKGKKKHLTKRQIISAQLAAAHLLQAYGIRTYADLVSHFVLQKAIIKSCRGRRSHFQLMILALKDYSRFCARHNKLL